MANLNRVFLIGNLTRDPELRYTSSGVSVCTLRLAVNRRFTTRQGEKREETLFIDVTVWSKQAEVCSQYLSKGQPVFIEGRLRQETWTGSDGQKRSKIGVVAERFQFLGSAPGGGATTTPPAGPSEAAGGEEQRPGKPSAEEDEIPF